MIDDPRSDLEKASERLERDWQAFAQALADSPAGRTFVRFADWLFTLGARKKENA